MPLLRENVFVSELSRGCTSLWGVRHHDPPGSWGFSPSATAARFSLPIYAAAHTVSGPRGLFGCHDDEIIAEGREEWTSPPKATQSAILLRNPGQFRSVDSLPTLYSFFKTRRDSIGSLRAVSI